jgi:hypothetical protein
MKNSRRRAPLNQRRTPKKRPPRPTEPFASLKRPKNYFLVLSEISKFDIVGSGGTGSFIPHQLASSGERKEKRVGETKAVACAASGSVSKSRHK